MKPASLLSLVAPLLPLDAVPLFSVGAADPSCDPCEAFGGRLGGDDVAADPSFSVGQDHGVGIIAEIRKLGGQACRMWGATPPGGGCNDGCLTPGTNKYCGKVLPYERAIDATGTVSYELKPNEWFWPLYWVDTSSAQLQINNLTYNRRPVFSGSAPLRPSSAFPANGHNLVPGLPAIDNTNGMVFELVALDGSSDSSVALRGHFVGIEVVSG